MPSNPSAARGARLRSAIAIAIPVLSAVATGAFAQVASPIKWSTIGNSITQGSGYPAKLQALLGPAFLVQNDGVSGTTLLKVSNSSYWSRGRFPQVFLFKPDIVTIKLGTNDSKPVNWPAGKPHFANDLKAMIDTLAGLSKPETFLCYPVPAWQVNGQWAVSGINEPVIKDEIMPIIKSVSEERKLPLIDLHNPLLGRQDLFNNDGVHPDAGEAGPDSIAAYIYRAFKAQAQRIACIGNSITDNSHNASAYPIKFNQLLGREYLVLNAGHSGYTLLRQGDYPYKNSPWLKEVFKFQPHAVTIKLGTNDSKPHNWNAHKNEYVADLKWLIDTLGTLPTKPRIVLLTPIPVWKNTDGSWPFGINGDVVKNEVIPKIKQVAAERNLTVIDLHTPYLPYQALTPDGVHPNPAGLDTIAHILYRAWKATPVAVRETDGGQQGRAASPVHAFPRLFSNPLSPLGVDASGRRRPVSAP